ncbi:MAG: Wzz/FepE/Etk N-terminal domain-containing protein [Eubacteriales bacterium]|nr:Wzz/FepE/Etk N-terminal domain-containing protein [Eubacteriales bacterium]
MTIDLAELLYRLLAKWKLIAFAALACAVIGGVFTQFFMTPVYEARSTIYVLSRRDSAINISDLQLGTALTADYVKVFDMWEVHEQVISNLDLPYSYKKMRGMIDVANTPNTRMLDITVSSPDPQEAAAIAGEYARVTSDYIAETMSTDRPSIMSAPLVPTKPTGPSMTKNVLLGFALGGALSAGAVCLRTILDDTYKSAEDIRRYAGLATLAQVPLDEATENNGPGRRPSGSRRRAS